MIASAHVAAGAVAGLAASRLTGQRLWRAVTAFTLGFLTHVALDALPHSDYGSLSRSAILAIVLVELPVMAIAIARLTRRRLRPRATECLLAGVVGAGIADAKFIAPMILPAEPAQLVMRVTGSFHRLFHAPAPADPLIGLAIEVGCTLVLLLILLAFPRVDRASVRHPTPVMRPVREAEDAA